VQDRRTRLAPAHAARAVERLSQLRVVELPQGEILEVALLLAMILAARKEAPSISEEQPLAIVKSEDAGRMTGSEGVRRQNDFTGSRWITDKRARDFLQHCLKDGPKPGAEIEAAAAAAAIPENTLIRAADALGVLSRRGEWRLPG
jgi:hypothetical protein